MAAEADFVEVDIEPADDFVEVDIEPSRDLRGGLELAYPAGLESALPIDRGPTEEPSASFGDVIRRLPAGVAESTADAAAGLLKVSQDALGSFPRERAGLGAEYESLRGAEKVLGESLAAKTQSLPFWDVQGRKQVTKEHLAKIRPIQKAMQKLESDPDSALSTAANFMRDVSDRARGDYGVDPERDAAFLSQVASGIGSVVPAVASGPLAPVTIAGMMGEQGRKDAEQMGGTPEQQDRAFYANAAVGMVSEALLGVPALLRSVKAAAIPEATFRAMAKSASLEALKASLREGSQEAIEQTAENLVAKYIAEYDPNRPETQGVWKSFLVGAATGAPTGALVQTAQNLSRHPSTPIDETGTLDIESGTVKTPDGRSFVVEETGVTEVVPGSPKDVSTSVLIPEQPKGEPSAVQIEETNAEVLRPESERASEGMGMPGVGAQDVVAETPSAETQPAKVTNGPVDPRGGLGLREWIEKRVSEGVTREVAMQEFTAAKNAANKWVDDLPTGSVVESPDGTLYTKESDGTLRGTGGVVFSGSPFGFQSEAQPAKVKLTPFEPQTTGEQIISTAIKLPDGTVVTGETWDARHPTMLNDPRVLNVENIQDVFDGMGFVVQDAAGNQRWANRQEAMEIARRSGQVNPESAKRSDLQSEILQPASTPKTEPAAAPEPVEAPPGPPPPPESPVEDRGRPEIPSPTGVRNRIVDENRIKMGLPPRMEPLRKKFGTEWDRAMEMADKNPDAGSALISELTKTPRALTPTETALLAHEQVTRENAYNEALRAVNEAPNEAARRTAETNLTRARDRNQDAYDAGQRAGTESGQSLAFRKLLVNRDYSLAAMEAELTALSRRDSPMSEAERAKIHQDAKSSFEKIKAAEARAQKAEERLAQMQGNEEYLKLLRGAKREASIATKEGKSILDRLISGGEEAASILRKRRQGGELMTSFTIINPVEFPLYVRVGAGYIAKGIKTVGEFTSRLVNDFGKDIEPHGDRIFNAAKQFHDEATATVPKVRSVAEAFARDKAGEALDPQVVYDVARAHVNAGVQGFEPTMQATLATLKANHPDLTMREVRDAFSGYGKVTRPSQAEDRVKLREYRRLGQLASAIEDAQQKIAPMKSGPQRDKASEAVRAKMAELKRVMQENGIEVTSPEQQLATAEKTATTRLQNTIESLERQIATKTRDAVAKGKRVATPEIEALRERVASLRETLDQVAPKAPESDAQKLQRSIDATLKRIDELDGQIRRGEVGAKSKLPGITSPRLERLRAERDAMTNLVRQLRDAQTTGKTPEQKKLAAAMKAVDSQIAQLDRQLQAGEIEAQRRKSGATSPELERKRAELAAMRELRNDLRSESKPKLTDEQRQILAVKKAIIELDRQIREGTVEPKNVPRETPSVELEALRSERDSMRALIRDLRNEAKVKRTPEEIALARYKKSIETRTKAIQDRIARGDYAKKARKETALDAEALSARFEYQKAKDAFEQKAFEYDLSRRGAMKRAYDTALEVLNTSRSIITSFDVSAPLRQGAFITLAHPIRSLRNIPGMFKAFGSEKHAFKVQESLSDPSQRPNAALYRQSGLDLTETGPNVTRRKLEEAYQSRWASKIPIVAGSQRAYTTFLNVLRADSFDAMVKNLGKGGKVTEAEAKAIASYINIATGRGKYGQKMEQATQALNAVFFAPKYVASRFQLILNPFTGFSLTGGSARVRRAVAAEYARFIAGAAVVIGLSQLAGADVELDPRSSEFGKIKIGNTRLDPFGGLSQVTTLLARTGTGETKTSKGYIKPLVPEEGRKPTFGQQTLGDTWARFLRQKLSPAAGAIVSARLGRDVVGQPTTPANELVGLAVPLSFGDIYDAMREQGVSKGAAMSAISLFGASMSTYDATERKPTEAQEPWEKAAELFR